MIDGNTIEDVYSRLALLDLPGINVRYEARLNARGIFMPLQFLHAPLPLLKRQVFQSIVGYYWYLRLRGHEIDGVDFGRKSYGQQYALGTKTTDREQLARLLMKLCEKTGRRLRAHGYIAQGVYLWLSFENRTYWAKGRDTHVDIYATQDIYLHAQRLLNQAHIPARVTNIGVTVYKLHLTTPEQLGLFDGTSAQSRRDLTAGVR
jgi:DNA polymerase-4